MTTSIGDNSWSGVVVCDAVEMLNFWFVILLLSRSPLANVFILKTSLQQEHHEAQLGVGS
jgi:hypothetical protein